MKRRRLQGALVACIVGSAACNSILGISDHPVEAGSNESGGLKGSGASGGSHASDAGDSSLGGVSSPGAAGDAGAEFGGQSPAGSGGDVHRGGSKADGGTNANGGLTADAGESGTGGTHDGGAGGDTMTAGNGGKASGGTNSGGKSSGGATAGGNASTGGSPSTCAPSCSGGKVCENLQCVCPVAKPDVCGATCYDLQSDKAHCGSCSRSCLAGTCNDGSCVPITLASGRTSPWALAVNASGVYWIEASAVLGVPLAGGTVVTLASSTYVTDPVAITASPTTIYYSNSGSGGSILNYRHAIMEVPVAGGGTPDEFAKARNDLSDPFGVTVVSGTVYWLDEQWQSIYKAAEGMGSEMPAQAHSGTSAGYSYYGNVVVDGTNAYWGYTNGGLFKAPLSSGTRVSLREPGSPGTPRISQIAVAQGNVYFSTGTGTPPAVTTPTNSTIYRIPISGGTATPMISGLGVRHAVAADATGVYFSDGDLKRMSHDGSTTVTLATGYSAGFIVLDAQYVYWTDASTGVVMKVAK